MRVDHLISDFTRTGVLLILSPLYNWQLHGLSVTYLASIL
jgi:hypothetical protein